MDTAHLHVPPAPAEEGPTIGQETIEQLQALWPTLTGRARTAEHFDDLEQLKAIFDHALEDSEHPINGLVLIWRALQTQAPF